MRITEGTEVVVLGHGTGIASDLWHDEQGPYIVVNFDRSGDETYRSGMFRLGTGKNQVRSFNKWLGSNPANGLEERLKTLREADSRYPHCLCGVQRLLHLDPYGCYCDCSEEDTACDHDDDAVQDLTYGIIDDHCGKILQDMGELAKEEK